MKKPTKLLNIRETMMIQSKCYKNEFASNLICSLDCTYGYYRNSLSFEFRSINLREKNAQKDESPSKEKDGKVKAMFTSSGHGSFPDSDGPYLALFKA
ncbi:hypothetical protein GLOIN_2v69068 [Rhizophagus irregularis DAOM 181602=DAOM 197198]|nr:hypothetical protein GLOIN_2v69068 [Rhizophagus irregularis DAOM 181602=DAOM 197198]